MESQVEIARKISRLVGEPIVPFEGGFKIDRKHEALAFVGFENYHEAVDAVLACLKTLNSQRCRHCGASRKGQAW